MNKPSYEELESKIRQLEKQLPGRFEAVSAVDNKEKQPVSVLIIDDDDSVRSSLASFLEDSDFIIFTACDGKQGINIFEKENIDIVLLDLRMPQMDGYDVITHIHKDSPQIPLIVISGVSGIQDAIETMKIGAWDYIVKPIRDMSTLLHSIERALEHSFVLNEKQRTEQLLAQSREKYSQLIKTTSSGFWQVDKNEVTIAVNHALCEMLGVTSEQIIGKSVVDFTEEKEGKTFKAILTDPGDTQSKNFGIVLKTKKGEQLYALFDAALTYDNNNEISGAFAFVSDVTERKKNHQLETAIETVDAICHELHQPMQTIFGSVELIFLEMSREDKNFEFVTIIKESIDRMTKILNQLSNITR